MAHLQDMDTLAGPSQDALRQLRSAEVALEALAARLNPFLACSPKDLAAEVEPLQQALVHLALAQAAEVVFRIHMRAAGSAEAGHPVNKASDRIRLYEKKVRKLESEVWLHHNSAQTQVNVAAANRFITAAIPDLTPAQRLALKAATLRVGEQARQKAAAPGQGFGKRKANPAEEADAFLAEQLGGSSALVDDVPVEGAKSGSSAAARQRQSGQSQGKRKAKLMKAQDPAASRA